MSVAKNRVANAVVMSHRFEGQVPDSALCRFLAEGECQEVGRRLVAKQQLAE